MKPPTKEAVDSALAILIESINGENGLSIEPKQRTCQGFDVTLNELELVARAVHLARQTIDAQAAAWATHVRKRRNHQTPIGLLPTELVANIILSTFRHNNRSSLKRMQELSSVCTMWWRTIVNFPAFWTTFDSCAPANVALKVKRSGNLPLAIRMRNPDPFASFHPSPLWSIDQNRLKSLTCSGKALESLAPVIRKLTRQLETLDLGRKSFSTPLNIKIAAGDHLRHVSLRSVTIAWSTLRNLKTLSITQLSLRDAPPPMQLLRICAACPLLEELVLSRIWEYRDLARLPEASQTSIVLSRLWRLELVGVPARISSALVSYIQATRLKVFKLREYTRSMPLGLPHETALSVPNCITLVATVSENTAIDRARVMIDRDTLHFTAYTPNEGIAVQLTHDGCDLNLVTAIANLIPPTVGQVALHLHFHIGGKSVMHHQTITLPLLKAATDIFLKASCRTTAEFITLLSAAPDLSIATEAGAITDVLLLAPRLGKLRLDLHGFTDDELRDVGSRVEAMKKARFSGNSDGVQVISVVDRLHKPILCAGVTHSPSPDDNPTDRPSSRTAVEQCD